ncbi:MAG: hypothetical protein ACFFA0_04965 [Promethearchaeota archaeon]
MELDRLNLSEEKEKPFVLIYILIIVIITIILTSLRIIFYIYQDELSDSFFFELLNKNRDLNFETYYNLMENGLIHYYDSNPLIEEKALYLYFWYFIFYPFHVVPLEISIYFWDLLRLVTTIFIAINIKKISGNNRDLLFFFLFAGIGYFADMYLNNSNWLIQLFLYESYIQLEKDNKFLSGIFFALSTFKIPLMIFPFILLLVKKIKAKDLMYYFFPFFLISIPYIIFPEFFSMMITNWFQSIETTSGFSIVSIFLKSWRLIQPAQLMFLSIITIIISANIENEEQKTTISNFIYISISTFWILIWLFLLGLALFL